MMYLAFMCALSIFISFQTHTLSSPLPLLPCFQPAIVNLPESFLSCSRPYTYNASSLCRSMLSSSIISLSYHQFTHSHAQVFVFAFSIFLQALLYKVVVFCCHNNTFMIENMYQVTYIAY